jgi:hypothetical protein
MVIVRLLAIADVVEALIETSPLFDVHTRGPHPSPLVAGSPAAARGGARIASESPIAPRKRETLETGLECDRIEMNEMGM